MTAPARRALPENPSVENLRKQAKTLAKAEGLKLAAAQRRLAGEYGFASWAELVHAIEARVQPQVSPLAEAALRGDEAAVLALLPDRSTIEGRDQLSETLWLVCASDGPAERRIAMARLLLDNGASPRRGYRQASTALHQAAKRGPVELVQLLLRKGALFWQGDAKDVRPYEYAQKAKPAGLDEILYLLQDKGPRTEDAGFIEAIAAVQTGDLEGLRRMLDARPGLLRERIVEPDIGQNGYFTSPKLFWFVANNPTLIKQSPDNIVAITQEMLSRGIEQRDLDYTLELLATNGLMSRERLIEMLQTLVAAGARMTERGVLISLGHAMTAPAAWLVEHGMALTAPLAAGLGRVAELRPLLVNISVPTASDALAMAVINRQVEAARLCLEAGADPSRYMPCHTHSTPLHQAAINGDIPMMKLLLDFGADASKRDTMWDGTPLGWAHHEKQQEAIAFLTSVAGSA